jgi:hypothetical protein
MGGGDWGRGTEIKKDNRKEDELIREGGGGVELKEITIMDPKNESVIGMDGKGGVGGE